VSVSRREAAIVGVVTVVAALPSLLPGFIHDDHHLIEQNELLRGLSRVPEILTRGYWTVGDTAVPNLYRPVTILSFLANHAIGGVQPFGYRLVNLGLHLMVALLVLALARRVLGPRRPDRPIDGALVAALLFAVHPVHTEALGLVVGRGDLLAAAGTLLCLLLFLAARDHAAQGDRRGARLRDAGALAAFLFGFFSKENAVAAPFIVLAADLTRPWTRAAGPSPAGASSAGSAAPRPRPAFGAHAALFAALATGLILRTMVLGMVGPAAFTPFIDNPIAHQPFPRSTLTALAVLGRYAGLLVVPAHLSIDHSYNAIPPSTSILEAGPAAGLLILSAAAAGMALAWKRRPALAFALLFAGLAFLPVANLLIPIGTIMAERLLYLPSVGFCLMAGALAAELRPSTGTARAASRAAIALVLLLFAVRGLVRLRDWRDDRTIFASAIAACPASVRAQYNYGVASEEEGDDAAAGAAYARALAIWDEFSDAHYNLAGVEARHQRWADAVGHYREATRLQPGNVSYLVNYGNSLTHAGRAADAIEPLERAVSIEATSDKAWNNLGAAYLALGRAGDAERAWREASRLEPASAEYVMNVAMAVEAGGDAGGAVEAWARAARMRPDDPIVRYRQGRALEKAGDDAAAAGAYRASSDLSPSSPVPWRALGLLLLRQGDRPAARAALERALALDSDGTVMDAEARQALAALQSAPSQERGGRP
jgi:Flp pilus assembly protein TadD